MRRRRLKLRGCDAVYHCMTRTVNGERLFGDREKEVLRKMLWQVADFCGVEILTYCVMSNHFHVLLRVRAGVQVSDGELMRRYRVLYPRPTRYQEASASVLEAQLAEGGEAAEAVRRRLLSRMADVSEFMKSVKQRFSIWFNQTHGRYGTLWAERFKSVLVEGQGNPLQTMAAYIDLNPVRAKLVEDPKDYRFCGYGEAVAGFSDARRGLVEIWSAYIGTGGGYAEALQAHRRLIYVKGSNAGVIAQEEVLRVLEREDARLSRAVVLRCRVRYFTDGVILGSREFVAQHANHWQGERPRPVTPKPLRGADWGNLAVIQRLRCDVFGRANG